MGKYSQLQFITFNAVGSDCKKREIKFHKMIIISAVLLHSDLLGHLGELQQQEDVFLGRERRQRNWRWRDRRLEILDGQNQEMGKAYGTGV